MFIEPEAGSWYYLQERADGWADPFDWIEQADAFGPFKNYEEACDHQYDYQPTTSGSEVWRNDDPLLTTRLTEEVKQKIALAADNMDNATRLRF